MDAYSPNISTTRDVLGHFVTHVGWKLKKELFRHTLRHARI